MEDGKVISRGVVAKQRDSSGDTVKSLLGGGPSDSDASEQSPQLRMRAPTGIKESAIALAPKRRMNVPLPAGWDGGTKKAAGRTNGTPEGQAKPIATDAKFGSNAPGRGIPSKKS